PQPVPEAEELKRIEANDGGQDGSEPGSLPSDLNETDCHERHRRRHQRQEGTRLMDTRRDRDRIDRDRCDPEQSEGELRIAVANPSLRERPKRSPKLYEREDEGRKHRDRQTGAEGGRIHAEDLRQTIEEGESQRLQMTRRFLHALDKGERREVVV